MKKRRSDIEINTKELLKLSNSDIKKWTSYIDEIPIKLTTRARNFCFYYVMNGLNSLEAVRMAKYSKKGEHVSANILLKNTNNKKAIKLIMDNELDDYKNKLEYDIIHILKTIKDYDILDYVDDKGTLKCSISKIPKQLRRIITKVETKYYGQLDKKVTTLEFMGKEYALNILIKYAKVLQDEDNSKNTLSDATMSELHNMLYGKKE